MCGLAGFSVINERTRKMAPFLAYEMENRGRDSWGMTNGVEIIRNLGMISSTFHIPESWEGKSAIFHTRAASVGAVTEANCHPFECYSDDSIIIGIHNGHVANHKSLNEIHTRGFDCDSPHIFQHIAEKRDMKEIAGYGTIAWYDSDTNDSFNLLKFNGGDLVVVRLESGELVFCSNATAFARAARFAGTSVKHEIIITSEHRYQLQTAEDGTDILFDLGSMRFGNRTVSFSQSANGASNVVPFTESGRTTYTSNYGLYYSNREDPSTIGKFNRDSNLCLKCAITKIDRNLAILCNSCMEKFKSDVDIIELVLVYGVDGKKNISPYGITLLEAVATASEFHGEDGDTDDTKELSINDQLILAAIENHGLAGMIY